MNLTQFSIEKNRITLSLLAAIVVMGIMLYGSLSRNSMPPYTIRVATIVSVFPGASPERIEELVTDKIEKVAQELPELKEVTSISRTGLSVVTVELKIDVSPNDLQSVWDRLRRKLNTIRDLPSNVRPILNDDGIGEVFGIAVGITSDGFTYEELKEYADDLRNDLIKLNDAAKVEIHGTQDERIFIEFDNALLRSYGLTSGRLQATIASMNILNSGGIVNLDDQRIVLEPTGNFNSVDDIKNMLIPVGSRGQVVALEDIADIKKGYIDPPSQKVRINGKRAVSLHVSLKEGANILKLGKDVDNIVSNWNSYLPIGLEVFRISSLDSYIELKVDDFLVNLLQAVIIVLIVMLFFLGFRTGFIIVSLIPLVTLATLMVMGILGVGINQVTLASLIMALGMMVDSGIVIAESILVKMENGSDARSAAIESCSELWAPLLISALITSAAFLSFFLAESVMGDIMGPLFIVIAISLLSSWVLALSIVTLLSVYFLKITKKQGAKLSFQDRFINNLKNMYKKLILFALPRKGLVLVAVVALFFFSLFGFTLLGFVFFPDSDRNMLTVDIKLPEGTRIETTEQTVLSIEEFIKEELVVTEERIDGINDWSSFIGEGPSSYDLGYNPDEPNSNYAHILVNTTSFEYNGEIIKKLDDYCFSNFSNADIKVGRLGAGGSGTPIEIKVSGQDPDRLSDISTEIKMVLTKIPFTKNVKDDWGPKGKKFIIEIDQSNAQTAGVTNQDIAVSLQTVLDGFQTGEYREGDKSIPIILLGKKDEEQSLTSLQSLNIYSQSTGKSVPFLQVASILPQWQYSKIKRKDLNRTIIVSSELADGGNASEIMNEVTPWLDEQQANWEDGYFYTLGGDAENTAENMGAVAKYLPLSGFIIMMLLIIKFNSIRKMGIILSTIPLGLIGMVIGLFIFRVPFGFMAFLGMISLAGIVINNAIVLMDRIETEQVELKRELSDAIVSSCLQRFRPILLASFTTILGLIPLYISGGEMWEPMAVTIMVGLLCGTMITLVFVPSLYAILYKVNYKSFEMKPELS